MELGALFADYQTAVLVGALGILVAFILYNRRRPKNFPPGPNGFPLVGVAPFLGKRPDKKINEYARKYGDVMGVDFGTHHVLVLSSYEVLSEAFGRQGDSYSARPWAYLHDVIWGKHAIAMNDVNDDWKEQKKFVMQSLRKYGVGKATLEGPILDEARFLCEALRSCEGDYKQSSDYIIDAVANVLCKITFGSRFNYDDDKSFMQYAHNLTKRFSETSFSLQACILLPWCYLVPPFRPQLLKMKNLFGLLHETIHGFIQTHIKELDPSNPRDFVDEYLIEVTKRNAEQNVGAFSAKTCKYVVRDLFVGGMETISSSISWCLLLLANRPAVQKRVFAEIEEVIGKDGIPTMRHKAEMHYLSAVMLEAHRYRTPLAFGLARMTTKDTRLCGYDIPKGTTVLANIYSVHNDTRLWKDPLEFNVDRHLDENGKFIKSNHIIPFGVGQRLCIGKQLGEMEFFMFLVCILQNFEVMPAVPGEYQYEDLLESGIIATPPQSSNLKLVERK